MTDIKTVGAVIDYLSNLPREWRIIMSKDAEGESYSPIADVDIRLYVPESDWSGETYLTNEDLDEELKDPESGFSEEDRAPEGAEPVIVLWPTN